MQNDPFDLKISILSIWKVLVSNIAFNFACFVYFNWGKSFANRIWVKNKNGLFDSKRFQVKCWNFEAVIYFRFTLCMCVCVCLRPFTVKTSSVCHSWNAREQINDIMLKTLLFSSKSFIAILEWSTKPFQLATLSCLHTRSGQSHDLAGVCISISNHKAFSYHYQASPLLRATS